MTCHLRLPLRVIAFLALLSGSAAQAQDWPGFLETRQMFRVVVTGLDIDGRAVKPVKGTAWAVAPGVLITADHVTGNAQNFKNVSFSDTTIIPARNVMLTTSPTKGYDGKPVEPYPDGIVTTSPFETIDAARIGVPNLEATPFALSACEIERNTEYRVVKFNGGSEFRPKSVSIKRKDYGVSKLGDAGSVAVMSSEKGTIVEGDSGSPVLDPEGRVIGLVSAINADNESGVLDEVHVTLVKSFLDLIPTKIGDQTFLDIPCSQRFRTERIDALERDLGLANTAITNLEDEKAKLAIRIGELEADSKALIRQVNTLLHNQIRLAKEAEPASASDVNVPDLKDMAILDQNELLYETGKKIFEQPTGSNTLKLRPTVTRISSELGSPEWTLSGSVSARNNVAINFSYERALSSKPYRKELVFCFSPIVWDVPVGTPNNLDPSNRNFYEPFEGPFKPVAKQEGQDNLLLDGPFAPGSTAPEYCSPVTHTSQGTVNPDSVSVTQGTYIWAREFGTIRDILKVARRNFPNAPLTGIFYLQIFELDLPDDNENAVYRLHTRALVDLYREGGNSNEGSAMPCKIFKDIRTLTEAVSDGSEELPRETICARQDF